MVLYCLLVISFTEEVIVTLDKELNLLFMVSTVLEHWDLIDIGVWLLSDFSANVNIKVEFKRWYVFKMSLKSEYSLMKLKFVLSYLATKDLSKL